MTCFNSFLSPLMRYALGFFVIGIILIYVAINLILLTLYNGKLMILVLRRQYYKF